MAENPEFVAWFRNIVDFGIVMFFGLVGLMAYPLWFWWLVRRRKWRWWTALLLIVGVTTFLVLTRMSRVGYI